MKHLFLTIIIVFAIISCDKVNDPYIHLDKGISEYGDPKYNDTLFVKSNTANRMIFIEDFTGHKCPNCPLAAEVGKSLEKKYPSIVHVTSIHNSNNFSKVDLPKFPGNFETETGENLKNKYGINNFPNGIINRISYNGKKAVGLDTWEDKINKLVNDKVYMKPPLDINSQIIYNTDKKTLRIYPEVKIKKDIIGKIYLSVFLTEKGIISPQIDSRASNSNFYVKDYEQHNILRAGFKQKEQGIFILNNPKIGDIYKNDTIPTSDYDMGNISQNKKWNTDSLDIIIFVYSQKTGEILQGSVTSILK